MSSKVFRETLQGAVRLDGWLSNKPKPITPRVIVPDFAEWILGDLAANVSGPAVVIIEIGPTALPEDLQRQIVNLASREDLVVWVHIRTQDNDKIWRAFCRRVSDSRMAKYAEAIPGLAEAL